MAQFQSGQMQVKPAAGAVFPTSSVPAVANLLDGFQNFVATTAATTIIAVPAGRTWIGTVTLQCAVSNAAAAVGNGVAAGTISTAGAGVTPAAGDYARCAAYAAANAATGVVGTDGEASLSTRMVIVAPAGNPVQLQCTVAVAGSAAEVNCSAIGGLQ